MSTLLIQFLSSHIYNNKSPVIMNKSIHIQSLKPKLQNYKYKCQDNNETVRHGSPKPRPWSHEMHS